MSMRAEDKVHEMGKNSQAVRAKLIDRTPKSGEMAVSYTHLTLPTKRIV